jgi:hypothetical protein
MLARFFVGLATIAVIGAGCSSNSPVSSDDDLMNDNSAIEQVDGGRTAQTSEAHWYGGGHKGKVTFLVRIENVSDGMTLQLSNGETAPAPNSPGVWTITRFGNPLFKFGRFDLGLGMEQQAEDGDPTMLAASMEANRRVKSSGVFAVPVGDAGPGPALPGKAYEFTVEARPGDHLSFSSMFGQSNDLFYSPGVFGIPLFKWGRRPISGDVTRYIRLWDAGTEVNQEPGLGPDQAPRQSGPNTGQAEHKRVFPVRDQFTYPAVKDVIKVTITPVEATS